ncbi:expressed unknown protein [Seminavis robusta]|uniref:Uncharacterized protein n=1 Tax=Seminavis robusta TaxID=568900 RepID=A0A9N8EBX2_9STRA|nr:expressed unknown protein [Seminavis robusta]|eukprot:Sro945_g223050.1 n/a (728) ;mRNA; r:1009-3297
MKLHSAPTSSSGMVKVSAFRLFVTAFLLWASFLVYTHSVFHAVAKQKGAHPIDGYVRKDRISTTWKQDAQQQEREPANDVQQQEREPAKDAYEQEREPAKDVYEQEDPVIEEADKGIPKDEASKLCVTSPQREKCIHEVMATNDMEVAKIFAKLILADDHRIALETGHQGSVTMHDAKAKARPNLMRMTEQQAIAACLMVHPDDREECKNHVLGFNDPDTAQHYVHLLQDQENLADEEDATPMTEAEIKSLCAPTKANQDMCITDVRALKNKHVAEHYIELLQNAHDTASLVSQRDAEKLCNHLNIKHRAKCNDSLITMNAKNAALRYSAMLKAQLKNKPRLTEKEAKSVCAEVPDKLMADCVKHTQTMNDPEVAQRYAQLLIDSEEDGAASNANANNNANANASVEKYPKNNNDKPNDNNQGVGKDAANGFCVKSTQREKCVHNVMATNEMKVAQKFAKLILDEEKQANAQGDRNGVTMHDAKVACALAIEKVQCIHDVFGTGDLDAAEMYDNMDPAAAAGRAPMTEEKAKKACVMVHKDDQEECKKHVMGFNDADTAEHYIHLLQDQENLADEENATPMTDNDVKSLCAPITANQEGCMIDVRALKNKHVAEHYIELLQNAHDSSSLVSQRDSEKLCNHLNIKYREKCTASLVTMNAKDAALHYSSILKEQLRVKPPLTQKEAESVCNDVPGKLKADCVKDALTMNNPEAAQRYAELLAATAEGR